MDLLFLATFLEIISLVKAEEKNLYFLAFWRDEPYAYGLTTKTAMTMAIEEINARQDVLSGYKLNVFWETTRCDGGYSVNNMYKQLYQSPTKIMILGASCSTVTEVVAATSQHWELITLSPISGSPALSDTSRFRLFFRLSAPTSTVNNAHIALMKTFNWKSVASINQPFDLFSKTTEDFAMKLHANNMHHITAEIFLDDPTQQIINIKRHDARIIFLGAYDDTLQRVFCSIYKQGLYGPRYLWVVNGYNIGRWWLQNFHKHDCTEEQMQEAVVGIISTFPYYLNNDEERGIAGFTNNEWMKAFLSRTDGIEPGGIQFGPITYDAVWAAALALNNTAQVMRDRGSDDTLDKYEYGDKNMTQVISDSLSQVEFMGVKGPIKFNEFGDNDAAVILRQVQDNEWRIVGFYDHIGHKLEWNEDNPIIWQNGKPPKDATVHNDEYIYVDSTTYYAMIVITSICIAISIGFGIFNFIYRQKRFIKMSSPKMNNLILIGCVLVYITVYLQEMSEDEVIAFCRIRTYGLMIGFSLAFGALFAKTWRVYAIFMNRTKRVVISDWQLFLVVVAIAGIDIILILVHEVADPITAEKRNIGSEEMENGDVLITRLVWVCTSSYDTYFKGVIYGIKGLLLIFGAFLAWQTRTVKIPALNDSQYIGMCIYNVAVLSLLGVVLVFALQDEVVLSYIISCCIILFATTVTQIIIFIPKISRFRQGDVDAEDTLNNSFGTSIEKTINTVNQTSVKFDLQKKNELLEEADKKIANLTSEVSQLKSKLASMDM